MAYSVIEVANEIAKYNSDKEPISLWKLQQMLYFHQGFYLASFGEPMFYDVFIAREYGPELDIINIHYKNHVNSIIHDPNNILKFRDLMDFKLFSEVNYNIGKYSSWYLFEIIKETDPYKNAMNKNKIIIPKEEMEEYFKKSKLLS